MRRIENKSRDWPAFEVPEKSGGPTASGQELWSLMRGLGEKLVIIGITGLTFFAATPAHGQDRTQQDSTKKVWERDLQKPGADPVKTSKITGLLGVTKVHGFTASEKSTFKPVTIADSLEAALADTLATLPRDVAQQIANCYWAASLHAVLQSDPHFLDTRVTRRGTSAKGVPIWAVRIHSSPLFGGRERTVFVEQSLPSSHLGAKTPNGLSDLRALRAALYEKAFAQALGGYSELSWGNSGRALRNMTGHKSAYTFMELSDPDRLFKKLTRRHDRNRPMVLVAFDLRDYMKTEDIKLLRGKNFQAKLEQRDPSKYGIVDQHCYSVVGTRKEVVDGKTVRLVELRDPRNPDKTFTKTIEEVQKAFFMLVTNRL